jgi:uncharacterized membrane protein YfcA
VLSGFVVGALVGITGVGGGALMTPILIFFGIPPVAAVGTDLLYASLTKTAGTFVHGYNHTVDWRVVVRLATGSIPGAAITLMALYELHIGSGATQILITRVLGFGLLCTALSLLFRKPLTRHYARRVGELDAELVRKLTIASGFVLGVLVSISSVGAGAIGVTALMLLYPQLPMRRIVGSDIAHAVPLTLLAGIGHWILGSIAWNLLGMLLLGSLPGIFVGSQLSARLPDTAVRLSLACVLLIVCGKLLFS